MEKLKINKKEYRMDFIWPNFSSAFRALDYGL